MHVTLPDGCRLHVREWGPAAGPTLLWVHGFPINSEMWVDASVRLATSHPGWRILAPDLRGFGSSDARFPATPSIATYADDLVGILDAAGVGRAVWGGLSMGGIICFEAYRRAPDRFAGLILSNTRVETDPPEVLSMREDRARLALDRGPDGGRAVAELMIGSVLAPEAPNLLRQHMLELMASAPSESVAFGSRALARRVDSRPTLATIRVPTLVVAGTRDQITAEAGLHAIFDAIPSQIEPRVFASIAGVGHVPPMEDPASFAAHVGNFLTQLPIHA